MHYVVGIDVSKSISQVVVAVDQKNVESYKISHDVFGFHRLNTSIQQFDEFPDIVLEATGVYSRHLKHFIEHQYYPYRYKSASCQERIGPITVE
ncbi:IS110 family transposase [Fructobacillus evanidus]|uniref:Transposase n=1 Tax=Fructobacillus evanidus TaxID=3064281 RepID=A0ABM9MY63_9LACO|nr:Transposase [Fructobacillus sp. LMG 32999]CAK1241788.1 Transposase [Fructobacillus sp. LMG 32999]CAK1248579.1 Transposase [Fructobacillus sp. LMG 32999]CAK1248587.1 Transposase [Fructobacillus sp. LMG 32999]CAK1250246.1 Transposase [Fructobacillus sp. LMG 32999]